MPVKNALYLIYNPTAGGRHRDRLDALVEQAQDHGFSVALARTLAAGHATTLAHSPEADQSHRMIVAGGDGTMNEVLNGLTEDSPPIGFAPFGTANVLAHELAYPKKFNDRMDAILRGKPRKVQLATANDRRFMLMASVGLDSLAVAGVDSKVKERLGPLAYIVSGAKALGRYFSKDLSYKVTIDDNPPETAITAIVTRAKKYGGPFVIAPDAGFGQDKLHVVMFKQFGIIALIRYAWGILTSRLHLQKGIDIKIGTRVTITSNTSDPVQIDGDDGGTLPLTVEMTDQRVNLIYPG